MSEDRPIPVTREWLIEHKVCLCCLERLAQHDQLWCSICFRRLLSADSFAMKGLLGELERGR